MSSQISRFDSGAEALAPVLGLNPERSHLDHESLNIAERGHSQCYVSGRIESGLSQRGNRKGMVLTRTRTTCCVTLAAFSASFPSFLLFLLK